jgi:A/G-specific adenine glycosylase
LGYNHAMSREHDLIIWYEQNRRHIPWREDPLPYHVYLSEIMLQQTQVDTVRSYYERFLKAFPTITDLAKASEDQVLKLWEGLGYYSRGRNLHNAAEEIVAHFGGEVPMAKEDLLSLPGIGAYTARAIRAIGFHQKEIAVDGNLIRVYSRLAEDPESNLEAMKEHCESFFLMELQDEDPSSFNQALMDLGEMVCLPKGEPLCDVCPFKANCLAHQHQSIAYYPAPKKAKEKREESWTVLLFVTGDEVAIQQRPSSGLLASLYQFPMLQGIRNKDELKKSKYAIQSCVDLGKATHTFSHLVWHLQGYRIEVQEPFKEAGLLWVKIADLKKRYSIPSAFAYYKKNLLEPA